MNEHDKDVKPFSHPRWHETLIPTVVKKVENPDTKYLQEMKEYHETIEKMSKKLNLPHKLQK